MRFILLLILFLNSQFIFSQQVDNKCLLTPQGFTKNNGQILDQNGKPNPNVLYLLNTRGLNVQLKSNGFSYDVYERKENSYASRIIIENDSLTNATKIVSKDDPTKELLFHRVDIDFQNTNEKVIISEHEKAKSLKNYYNISGKEHGLTKVGSFHKIVYHDLYKGIDLEFFVPKEKNKPVEYNFIVRPEGDISTIKMKVWERMFL